LEKRKYLFTGRKSIAPVTATTITSIDICSLSHICNFARRSRSELDTTETELKAMAAEAMMGLSKIPKKG
jgi:hypothetical protein